VSYLIDGSNLGGVKGGRRGARDSRAVVEWLLPWVRSRSADRGRLIVVFDGAAPPDVATRYGPLEVEFAAPRSADEAIVARVRSSPSRWIVVTNDRALARTCRDLGANTHAASTLATGPLDRSRAASPRSGRGRPAHEASDKPHPSGSDQGYWKSVFEGGGGPPDDEE